MMNNHIRQIILSTASLALLIQPIVINAETTTSTAITSTFAEKTTGTTSTSLPSTTGPTPVAEVTQTGPLETISEGIIGEDNQHQVTDTTQTPYRQIVHLEIEFASGNYLAGSGAMIGPDLILTAAHNVYDSETGEWAKEVYAAPGRNGTGQNPYEVYDADSFVILKGFQAQGASQYDMAIIKLSQKVDSRVGQLDIAKTAAVGQRVQVPGFPFATPDKQYFMYTMFGEIQSISEKIIHYQIDTEGGQSGSPVLNAKGQIVGIHIAGFTNGTEYVVNGARVVDEGTDKLVQAMRTGVGNNEVVFHHLTRPVYRLYHAGVKRHLYTQSSYESRVLSSRGWRYEGEKFKTATQGASVYRLYHSGTREHLYTTSKNERDVLKTRGWRDEDVAWYSAGQKPIYRLYHAGLKVHLYTADTNEREVLSKRGWTDEGISFFVK